MQGQVFSYGDYELEYDPKTNYYGLLENYLLNIYKIHELRQSDIVVDIGAGIGDYSLLAAKRAAKVIALEPNIDDFKRLEYNIKRNGYQNKIIPINIGVGAKEGKETITFAGNTFSFVVQPLKQILKELPIDHVDIVKMDIEGYEVDVIKDNLDLLSGVRAIAIELHGTKNTIDRLLLPHGFTFEPLTKGYVLKQAIWQLLSHPITFLKIYNCLPNKSGKVEILKGNEHGLIVGMYYRNS